MTNSAEQTEGMPERSAARRFTARLLFLGLLWFGLNGGDWASWMMGVPVVLAGAVISQRLRPPRSWRWSWRGALVFGGYFLRASVLGAWDVAWRAMLPGIRLSPAIMIFVPRLPAGTARLFFCNTISLLPGTAVMGIEEERLHVHVLDASVAGEGELRELEEKVAGLFGLRLADHGRGGEA